jgi:hypothetical protein
MKEQFRIALDHYKNNGTPYDFLAIRCESPGCDKASEELEEGVTLKKCGKCHDVSYCSKECQKGHWLKHKKLYKTPKQQEDEEKTKLAGRPWRGLNI